MKDDKMRVLCYQINNISNYLDKCKAGLLPSQSLYGIASFYKYGIDIIYYQQQYKSNRFFQSVQILLDIMLKNRKYDVLYGTSFRGLELIIFLRAIKIYRKPIAIIHHTAIFIPKNKLRRMVSRFFYKGIDEMFYFSKELMDISIKTGKVKHATYIHWGADLDFYDKVKNYHKDINTYFLSTGKENRDIITLLTAFQQVDAKLEIYLPISNGINYKDEVSVFFKGRNNINIHWLKDRLSLLQIAEISIDALCIVIPVLHWKYLYPVGLTSIVEAMALGKPIITTNNPYLGIDVEKEGIGIKVDYGDVEGWVKAVKFMVDNPQEAIEMGRKGRALAERIYNIEYCSNEIATRILKMN